MMVSGFHPFSGDRLSEKLNDLVVRIAAQDEEAMRLFYQGLSGEVFNCAYAMLHDFHAAQDIQQETFLKVWKNAGRSGDRNSPNRRRVHGCSPLPATLPWTIAGRMDGYPRGEAFSRTMRT